MIVGLKGNVPYIIKSVPKWNIDGEWIKEQILDSSELLPNQESFFTWLIFFSFHKLTNLFFPFNKN